MKTMMILACLMVATNALAAQVITLDDGRQVELNDDFTWHYVAPVTSDTLSNDTASSATVKTIPLKHKTLMSVITLGSDKPIMQLSDSGVDVLLDTAQYRSGQLVIASAITNQSSQSVVSIELEIELADMSGNTLLQDKITIWNSIKRLADTYLRPQQVAAGKTIQIKVPQANQYQLSAKITHVETR